jgi:hypothetical protein
VRTTIAAEAVVHTDGWQGHRQLSRLGYDHRSHSRRAAPAGEWLLPRAHRSISNLKAWLHGTHRDVSREHLQAYRHEYVFRHNGRRTPIAAFQTPLGRGTPHPTTHQQITTRTLEWTLFRGRLWAFVVRPGKEGPSRASNPTCVSGVVPARSG